MSDTAHTTPRLLSVSPVTMRIMGVACLLLLVLTAIEFGAPHLLGRSAGYTDFSIFHFAGELFWKGDLIDAYDAATLMPLQWEKAGFQIFMPWTYPPQFNLVTAVLATLQIGIAFFLFAGLGLILWTLALRRLAGPHSAAALILTLPAVIMNLRTGQNGLYTGALFAFFCHLSLRGSARAGIPLGLLAYKPHLAVGLVLYVFLRRQWAIVAVAAAVTAVTLAISTLILGPQIWPAFLSSARESSHFLREGFYPLFRMTSVFATVRSFDGAATLATALHLSVALAALSMIVYVSLARWEARRVLAVAVLASLCVSPYNYDYDMGILAAGLALAAPDLARLMPSRDRILLLLACWTATGYGLVRIWTFPKGGNDGDAVPVATGGTEDVTSALAAFGLLAALGLILRTLARAEAAGRAETTNQGQGRPAVA